MSRTFRNTPPWILQDEDIEIEDGYIIYYRYRFEHDFLWGRTWDEDRLERIVYGKMVDNQPSKFYPRLHPGWMNYQWSARRPWFKQQAHRNFRVRQRSLIYAEQYELLPTKMREVSDIWDIY